MSSLTVEKILDFLYAEVVYGKLVDEWKCSFVTNVHYNVIAKNGQLSTKQGEIALKIVKGMRVEAAAYFKMTVAAFDAWLESPRYDRKPYLSANIPREVRYMGDGRLAFRFKLDPTVVDDIKGLKSRNAMTLDGSVFDRKHRLWIVSVSGLNVERVLNIIDRHKFQHDQSTYDFLSHWLQGGIKNEVEYDAATGKFVMQLRNCLPLAEIMRSSVSLKPR